MGPVRHHFLPRFLLKGFAICENPRAKPKRRKWFTNASFHGDEAVGIHIEDIGVADKFYKEVESKLAVEESGLANTLRKVLKEDRIHKSQWGNIRALVLLLTARTKALREYVKDISEYGVKTARRKVEEVDFTTDEQFIQMYEESVRKRLGRRPTQAERLLVLKHFNTKEFKRRVFDKMITQVDPKQLFVDEQLKYLATEGFKDSTRFTGFEWELLEAGNKEFILGDIGPLSLNKDSGEYWPTLFVQDRATAEIVLPVCDQRAIIGRPTGEGEPRTPEVVTTVNVAASQLSREFIVAKSAAALSVEIRKRIGTKTDIWEMDVHDG